MRPTALPASLDGLRLRAELAAATRSGWASSSSRKAGLAKLKKFSQAGQALAATRLKGKTGGLEASRTLSGTMNALLRALFDSILADLYRDNYTREGIALCALGGFGAGELGPQSDIDVMFLISDDPPEQFEVAVERTLYALWDTGLPVGGGAIRTIDEAIDLARENLSERTALLDLRLLSGDENLVGQLKQRFDSELREPDGPAFVEAKLAERDARLERQGDSRYAVEPNVKDGKGALRDLQTLRWLAQVLYGQDAMERWVLSGFLSVKDVERYLHAEDFFWTVRFHLHRLTGRKDDRISFDRQTEIAQLMGYEDSPDSLAVESFMRDYFLCAIDVGALTRLVCAKLEAEEKARAENNYKELFESQKEESNTLRQTIEKMNADMQRQKINEQAVKLAASLTKDTGRAQLLQKEFSQRLALVDGELRVTDPNGQLTVSSLEDLVSSVKTDYPFLVDGIQASGGGATKAQGGAEARGKEMSRSDWEALPPAKRQQFFKDGGKLYDE